MNRQMSALQCIQCGFGVSNACRSEMKHGFRALELCRFWRAEQCPRSPRCSACPTIKFGGWSLRHAEALTRSANLRPAEGARATFGMPNVGLRRVDGRPRSCLLWDADM